MQETAQARGGKVVSLKIRVGELAQFDLRLVKGLLKDLVKGTSLEGMKVAFELEKSKVRCLSCSSIWGFDDVVRRMSKDEREAVHFFPELISSYYRCPSCSRSYFDIEAGRSVSIAEVVLSA